MIFPAASPRPAAPKPGARPGSGAPARLLPGEGTRMDRRVAGMTLSRDLATWKHPWHVTPFFWAEEKKWVAVVRPGFVNGRCPVVQTTAGVMRRLPAFTAPLTARAGAADIAQAARLADSKWIDIKKPGQHVDVPLYEGPVLPLVLRELVDASEDTSALDQAAEMLGVSLDSLPSVARAGALPNWFKRRGVELGGERRVASCDLVLHQPRMALTSEIREGSGIADGTSLVRQTLGVRPPPPADKLKVIAVDKYQPPESRRGIDPLANLYEEETFDELLIATVWLVSPAKWDGPVNGAWMPFVRHALFWNLHWRQEPLRLLNDDPLATYIPPLAGGLAQLFINGLMAGINDAVTSALNRLQAHSMAGEFWTATGGGSTAQFREEDEDEQARSEAEKAKEADDYGLDKDARARAKLAAALKKGVLADTLDPRFPFVARPFPTRLL